MKFFELKYEISSLYAEQKQSSPTGLTACADPK